MNLNDVNLTPASRAYAIANTPLFVVRKLQEDPSVQTLGRECPGEDILASLQAATLARPENPVEAVKPYALLVALWFKPELGYLQEAARIRAQFHPWFGYIAEALISTFSPIQSRVIAVPGQLSAPTISPASTASVNRIKLSV
jgi:hypothetical protein